MGRSEKRGPANCCTYDLPKSQLVHIFIMEISWKMENIMRILLRWRANDIPAILYIFVSENRKTSGQCQFLPSSTVFTLHKLSLSPENKKIGCAEKTEQTGQPENLVLVEFRTGVTMICLVDGCHLYIRLKFLQIQ